MLTRPVHFAYAHWLTPSAAAQRLGVSALRVRQILDAGDLVCVRTPLGRLIDPASLEALIRKRAASSTEARP